MMKLRRAMTMAVTAFLAVTPGLAWPDSAQAARPQSLTQVSVGDRHSCGLTAAGRVICWGNNDDGKLGNGTTTSQTTPVTVLGLENVQAIAAGGNHTCAITSAGAVKCWGTNRFGQLGDGLNVPSSRPVQVWKLTSGYIQVQAGYKHTCALHKSGSLKCWGGNNSGQLGNNKLTPFPFPRPVIGLSSGVRRITAGGDRTCAITVGGALKCWGNNHFRALGNGGKELRYLTPQDVVGFSSGVTSVSTGDEHTCAIKDQKGYCWGRNDHGQLGTGDTTTGRTPQAIKTTLTPVSITTGGGGHSCLITAQGQLACWGFDVFDGPDQLTPKLVEPFPVRVAGISADVGYSDNSVHRCVLATSGSAWCWGRNDNGQLGNGQTSDKFTYTPTRVIGTAAQITNRVGEATADTSADVWAYRDVVSIPWLHPKTTALEFFEGSATGPLTSRGFRNTFIANSPTSPRLMSAVHDLDGDYRADLFTVHKDGSAWIYRNDGDGYLEPWKQIGQHWQGIDLLSPVGNLGGDYTQYLLARRNSDNSLWRYKFTSSGITNGVMIGQHWASMRVMMGPGDFNKDGQDDLMAIRTDGKLFIYYGTKQAKLSGAKQVGQGWTTFKTGFIPGDLNGDNRRDLIGWANNGNLYAYHNTGKAWGPARTIGNLNPNGYHFLA